MVLLFEMLLVLLKLKENELNNSSGCCSQACCHCCLGPVPFPFLLQLASPGVVVVLRLFRDRDNVVEPAVVSGRLMMHVDR